MTLTLLNNRYRIIRELGAGGFGNTFLAEDTQMPSRRTCVIKQLKPVTDNPRAYEIAKQRFDREAAVLEELGEGNSQIPKLYAYFSEAGQFYLVQESIEGKTLTEKVQQQGVFKSAAVRDILVRLLPVLEYVHSKRIIHRDIKPENIILRDPPNPPYLGGQGGVPNLGGQGGVPVLIDFGAVKEAMGTTTQSIVIGTPGFMPPEQTVGQPVYSSDLYSLALTAIYLLTGKIPQELATDSNTGEIIWHENARNVGPNLTAVLDKAIRRRAEDRFSTAREMLDALQPSVAGAATPTPSTQSTLVVSPNAPDTANLSPQGIARGGSEISRQKHQKRWAIGILTASAVIGSAIVAFVSITNKSHQPSRQVSQPTASSRHTPAPSESATPETPSPDIAESPSKPRVHRSKPNESQSPASHKPGLVEKPGLSESVPIFPTGTPRSTVKAALGEPVKDARGAWGNTRAVIYNYKPNQIDLGYLFDNNSGQIRQTEVSFAASVEPKVMLTTLDSLLNGEATPAIKRGLRRVQQGKSNAYVFTTGSLKGQIVRQDCGFIYISIWDADLHNFNVASSRKC